MNILIPMAGAGSRFANEGYTQSKPLIPVTSRRTGSQLPMVVAATNDLPVSASNNFIFITRNFHQDAGIHDAIKTFYPNAHFMTVKQLTDGQASTCLSAKAMINNDTPLLIAACDNGMDIDAQKFTVLTTGADAIIFTFQNNPIVTSKPEAYGWVKTAGDTATGVSIKHPVSATPMNDHAIVGTFWFRQGSDFVTAAETMIAANDRINNEFYVDQVFKYLIANGLRVKVFPVARYLCWGTPEDYETYEATFAYWRKFALTELRYEQSL